jgi:hypothetical protein
VKDIGVDALNATARVFALASICCNDEGHPTQLQVKVSTSVVLSGSTQSHAITDRLSALSCVLTVIFDTRARRSLDTVDTRKYVDAWFPFGSFTVAVTLYVVDGRSVFGGITHVVDVQRRGRGGVLFQRYTRAPSAGIATQGSNLPVTASVAPFAARADTYCDPTTERPGTLEDAFNLRTVAVDTDSNPVNVSSSLSWNVYTPGGTMAAGITTSVWVGGTDCRYASRPGSGGGSLQVSVYVSVIAGLLH